MKKLSVLVALIMAITVFWIPGQSVFAEEGDETTVQAMAQTYNVTFYDGEGENAAVLKVEAVEEGNDATPPADPTKDGFVFKSWKGDYTNVTEPRSIYAEWEQEETTEPTTEPEPVVPKFNMGKVTSNQTQVFFDWTWTEGEGTKTVKIWFWKPAIRDRNSSYTYYVVSTNGKYFSGLSDGTVYNYSLVASVNGKTVYYEKGKTIKTLAKKANGWLTEGAKQYYYVNGVKQRNTLVKIKADGATLNHYFDCNGVFRGRSDYMYSRVKGLSSKAYLICVDRTNNVTCVYRGGKNNWTPLKYWSCVTGRMKRGDYHPTPLGVYKVKSKKKTFSGYGIPEKKKNRYSVWHCTRFVGSVFFHSQLYKYKSTSRFIPGGATMGRNASHGCIRLHKANAYWIYKNCAKGTTVVIIQ